MAKGLKHWFPWEDKITFPLPEWRRRESYQRALETIINARGDRSTPSGLTGIVFSKDRPLQLHALLFSALELIKNPPRLIVLYHSSSAEYEKAYAELTDLFKRYPQVIFIRETSFRNDLLRLIDRIETSKVFFLVDDIVFTHEVDFSEWMDLDEELYVPSLRLGGQLTSCYMLKQPQPLPPFISGPLIGDDCLVWKWKEGRYDWNYPLSVDGHLFNIDEIRAMFHALEFKAPNTLEGHLQVFTSIFLDRYGVCYPQSKIVNIPCNKVQQENQNTSGNEDPKELLRRWNDGFQMDYRRLYGFQNISVHQEISYDFVRRT